jgi:hypothetical protein
MDTTLTLGHRPGRRASASPRQGIYGLLPRSTLPPLPPHPPDFRGTRCEARSLTGILELYFYARPKGRMTEQAIYSGKADRCKWGPAQSAAFIQYLRIIYAASDAFLLSSRTIAVGTSLTPSRHYKRISDEISKGPRSSAPY